MSILDNEGHDPNGLGNQRGRLGEQMRLDGLRKENARAWAEVDRLRAALTKIATDGKNCTDYCRRTAERALNQ